MSDYFENPNHQDPPSWKEEDIHLRVVAGVKYIISEELKMIVEIQSMKEFKKLEEIKELHIVKLTQEEGREIDKKNKEESEKGLDIRTWWKVLDIIHKPHIFTYFLRGDCRHLITLFRDKKFPDLNRNLLDEEKREIIQITNSWVFKKVIDALVRDGYINNDERGLVRPV